MSDYIDYDFRRGKYLDEPKWLSWLQVQEQAVYTLDPETESEEELWARSIARNGIDEGVYSFVDAYRHKHALEQDHGYYSRSTVDLAIDKKVSGHDWISSETVSPVHDQTRLEFKPQTVDLADRPDETFFLGLPGLRFIDAGLLDNYLKYNRLCDKCRILTPKSFAKCQNCED